MDDQERLRRAQERVDEEGCGAVIAEIRRPLLDTDYLPGRYERRDRFWTGE